jgi:hypothetical protein
VTAARTRTLAEVIDLAVSARLAGLHTHLPARVERYDAATQFADVVPSILARLEDDDGGVTSVPLPVLTNIPVVFPGAGGFRITFPVQPGDTVWLCFSERSIDEWKSLGGQVAPVDPRQHALPDAVALVGLHDTQHAWAGAAADHATLGADQGPQIHLRSDRINLGGDSGLQPVAVASTLKAHLDALKLWLDMLRLPVALDPVTHALVAGPSLIPSPAPPAIGSSVVNVKV